jgi:hypothetical protein
MARQADTHTHTHTHTTSKVSLAAMSEVMQVLHRHTATEVDAQQRTTAKVRSPAWRSPALGLGPTLDPRTLAR